MHVIIMLMALILLIGLAMWVCKVVLAIPKTVRVLCRDFARGWNEGRESQPIREDQLMRTPFKVALWTIIVPIFAVGGYYIIVDLAK